MVLRDELKPMWDHWTSRTFQDECEAFEVVIEIRGVWAGDHETSIDSILASLFVNQTGLRTWDDRQSYALPVPLKMAWQNDKGLPLWYANPFKAVGTNQTQTILVNKPFLSHREIVKKPEIANKKIKQTPVILNKGLHKARAIAIPANTAQVFRATGIGHIETVRQLLDDLQFVGRRRTATVVSIEVNKIEDFQWERSIPIAFNDGRKHNNPHVAGFTPPYFKRILHEICA